LAPPLSGRRSWLHSADSRERKIAATISGQEQLRQTIPRLKELLADAEYEVHLRPALPPWVRVYYVREAAQEALQKIEEDGRPGSP